MPYGSSGRTESGETLIELLVAVTLLGTAAIAVVLALFTSIIVSDVNHKQATAGMILKNYAEAIETSIDASATAYLNGSCPTTGTYATPGSFTQTSGYTASITAVKIWNRGAFPQWGDCGAGYPNTSGLQKLYLKVASADGRDVETLQLVIRNPCRQTDALCSS